MTAAALPVYLRSYLAPLAPMLERADVTDIFVNRPGELWIETTKGALEHHAAPELDETGLWRLARQIASLSNQGISREHPLLSATLPGGERVQIVAPPATRGPLAMAVRKHVVADLELADYERDGAFDAIRLDGVSAAETLDRTLSALLKENRIADFLRLAVRSHKNIVVSGGTATGKTTFVNALLREVPREERLVLIEDAPEIQASHPNSLGLVSVRGELGEAQITTDHLVQASLRLRPDRIILGEIRGPEAVSFLRAVNTGHPGSITTIHADSPRGAVDQLSLLALQAGLNIGRTELSGYIMGIVDVFVQLARRGGSRVVSEIAFRGLSGIHPPPA
jgi:type IV secretion system protein VirB11